MNAPAPCPDSHPLARLVHDTLVGALADSTWLGLAIHNLTAVGVVAWVYRAIRRAHLQVRALALSKTPPHGTAPSEPEYWLQADGWLFHVRAGTGSGPEQTPPEIERFESLAELLSEWQKGAGDMVVSAAFVERMPFAWPPKMLEKFTSPAFYPLVDSYSSSHLGRASPSSSAARSRSPNAAPT